MKHKLKQIDPRHTGKFREKSDAAAETDSLLDEMYRLLYLMFAEDKRSLLVILQGIDASGKDGVIKHIFSGANPQGIRSYSFKEPSQEELRHDFLWRCHRLLPERGTMAIFNRSYYEDVTAVKVHPEYLKARPFEASIKPPKLFEQRYRQINEFERTLTESGTVVMKFFLHISKDEQKERLQERLEDPSKKWKFAASDVKDRKFWNEYQKAFQEMLDATNSKHCPWHVIPADRKWFRNYLVSKALVEELQSLKMKFPSRPAGEKIKIT